jgi:hypothetical protein
MSELSDEDERTLRGPWRWFAKTIVILLAVYGAIALVGLVLAPWHFLPAEDAVILYQYSYNLAHHSAITYYAGGPHAEGATDFAWMVLVAFAVRLGIEPFAFSCVVSAGALLGVACVLVRLAGMRLSAVRVLAVCGAAAMVPQMVAAGAGFAVLIDALLLSMLALAVMRKRVLWACVLGFVFCLFRPDGVVFAAPLLGGLLVDVENRRRRLVTIVLCFLLPGMLYFAWRSWYFGALFPLPFLVKSDVHRTLGVLVPHSMETSFKYLLFDAALLVPAWWQKPWPVGRWRLVVGLVIVPTLFYWAMRLDQNVGDRFFFYLPLAAALLIAASWETLAEDRRRMVLCEGLVAWLLVLFAPLSREVRTFRDYQFQDVDAIAKSLGQSSSRGSLLSAEAGFLAYESGWVAYDAWGLNTERFARKLIQPEDIVQLRPDLIAFHPYPSESCLPQQGWAAAYAERSWEHMSRNLVMGAQEAGDYQLWILSYGSPFYRLRKGWEYGHGDRECFLLRSDSSEFASMAAALRDHNAVEPPESMAIEQSRR